MGRIVCPISVYGGDGVVRLGFGGAVMQRKAIIFFTLR
jgi:hypothetical protein